MTYKEHKQYGWVKQTDNIGEYEGKFDSLHLSFFATDGPAYRTNDHITKCELYYLASMVSKERYNRCLYNLMRARYENH
jgi:hypothetical protein